MTDEPRRPGPGRSWRAPFRRRGDETPDQDSTNEKQPKSTWTMGILNDRETIEVPGTHCLVGFYVRNVNSIKTV